MATFKPGDEVRYIGTRLELKGKSGPVEQVNGRAALVNSGSQYSKIRFWANEIDLELVKNNPPLVGPKPKVDPPVFQSPFKFDEGEWILDAQGNRVLRLPDGMDRKVAKGDSQADYDAWDDFARYVAEALNEKVNREEAA